MSMNIEFSDLYEQCGNCAGTGTVIETTTYGTPFRKQCPKCHGLGSIKKPSYRHRGPRDWDEGDQNGTEPTDDDEADLDPQTAYDLLCREVGETQAILESQVMQTAGLTYDDKLQLWMRLHVVDPHIANSEDGLDSLIHEAEERGMTGIACELKELVIKYLQLRTLQIRLKLRSES